MLLTIKKVDQFKTILIWHFDCVNKNSTAEMCLVYTCSYAKICMHRAHMHAQIWHIIRNCGINIVYKQYIHDIYTLYEAYTCRVVIYALKIDYK